MSIVSCYKAEDAKMGQPVPSFPAPPLTNLKKEQSRRGVGLENSTLSFLCQVHLPKFFFLK